VHPFQHYHHISDIKALNELNTLDSDEQAMQIRVIEDFYIFRTSATSI
jgi:hypothetical protein